MSLRLKVACVSRWSEYFPKEQRADVLWVCVCVCMSGQVWRYEEADGFYGDGGDGDTTHTGIRAQRGNGWRWHWWVCDVISCSQWRDYLKGLGWALSKALSENYHSLPESFWLNWRVIWEDFHECGGPWLSGEEESFRCAELFSVAPPDKWENNLKHQSCCSSLSCLYGNARGHWKHQTYARSLSLCLSCSFSFLYTWMNDAFIYICILVLLELSMKREHLFSHYFLKY